MGLPKSGIVTVRLAPRDADDIDALVADGQFQNRSDFIRYAVKATLEGERRPEATSPELADPLAGPGAFTGTGSPARRPGRTPRKGVR